MLFNTSLVALVGSGESPQFSPRKLMIVNTKRESVICELSFVTSILSVRLNRKRLVVLLENHLHVYDISNMKILHSIDIVSKSAIIALSPSSDNCYLAYPATASNGEIMIFDCLSLQSVHLIQAHKNPVTNIAFDYDGTKLVTASEKGTVIRVFSVPDGQRLYQFRRGSLTAHISSLSFNLQGNMITVCSDTDTVHIYKLVNSPNLNVSGYLPEVLSEMIEPLRDFAHLKLPRHGLKSLAVLSANGGHVLCATSDGVLLVYSIDLENGGECVFLKQHSLLESSNANTDKVQIHNE